MKVQDSRPGVSEPSRVEAAGWNLQRRIFLYGFDAHARRFRSVQVQEQKGQVLVRTCCPPWEPDTALNNESR